MVKRTKYTAEEKLFDGYRKR